MKELENGNFEVTYQQLASFRNAVRKEYLQEIKDHLRKNVYEGSECPCCKSFIKANKVPIGESMIRSLESLYLLTGNDTLKRVHKDQIYKHWKRKSNVIGKLKYWDLVVQFGNGEYTITTDGIKFLNGSLAVNEYYYIFRDGKIKPNEEIPKKSINQFKSEW